MSISSWNTISTIRGSLSDENKLDIYITLKTINILIKVAVSKQHSFNVTKI